MKPGIHPKLYDVIMKCVCGGEFPSVSTKSEISVDVCSNCHPLYTGKARMMDTEGRVSRFEKKYKHLKNTAPSAKKAVPKSAASASSKKTAKSKKDS